MSPGAEGDPMSDGPALVLYDGACGLCRGTMERGRRGQRPGALEWLDNASPEAQAALARHGLLGQEEDSLIVVSREAAFLRSDAIVRVMQGLRWPWRVGAALRFIPNRWRDAAYRHIAARRSRDAVCRLPVPPAPVRHAETAEPRGN